MSYKTTQSSEVYVTDGYDINGFICILLNEIPRCVMDVDYNGRNLIKSAVLIDWIICVIAFEEKCTYKLHMLLPLILS